MSEWQPIELKTYRDVLKAISEGYEVEYLNSFRNWVTLKGLDFELALLDITYSGVFRIKTHKPSIDWDQVSDKYNWLARCKNGQAYLHTCKPKLGESMWYITVGDWFCANAETHKSYKSGNCDWTESLVERPKEQSK